ncbi:hypothetical protein [Flavihumibacter petaseus]|uniref:HTH cro/C1-type domain-containing protein n=1 Tax=Flavihumibacter petaseus NBRC 106054 TaxID=1220578 RepID=A0A0E9MUS4_9BACT|nr:hypothetical protein [Flavihumibacter petaseus]GAO41176.1 hypothetical protein FPE01S_01_01880 [Flavihumibacter petaseus NBRC 106054]
MEKDQVPQDKKIIHGEDNSLVKVLYVTDKNGKYGTTQYTGWEAENLALSQAWDDIDEKIEITRQRVLKGELSPIAYYMEKSLMDLPTLAKYVGLWKFRVKRHLRPSIFKKLSDNIIQRYAGVFNISPDDLKHSRIVP